jgi:clan AA aspartic protease
VELYGTYRDHAPRLSLVLPGLSGELQVEFVVDTAFEGDLSMPPTLLRQLNVSQRTLDFRSLADGTIVEVPVYSVELNLSGEEREVEVISLASRPLLGTLLLDGCRLEIDMEEGGEVVVEIPD